ncbi:uncharacterized protein CTRU02_209312 [Colletotrichum truncatum]|uniref:Uncharacterized protein n=1 Tax=Colletotrichum truncatum TaxID=5467 RepID=A0ACC3YS75_COLTU|nr:uncharacterized protein CTRU02_08613 [Colletotrichum truncatum]KAF6789914.1 hypothetical protein CTRU02_08613 [Colletotrichum truncatum]
MLCLIDPYKGEPEPIAWVRSDTQGKVVVLDINSKKDVSQMRPCSSGVAIWGKRGEFTGFKEDFAASWVHGPGQKPSPFRPGVLDAYMGARRPCSGDDIGTTDDGEVRQSAAPTGGPDLAWQREANEILGIEDDYDVLSEPYDYHETI